MSAPIARVEAALRQLGTEHHPPPGWDTRVLEAIGPRNPWWRQWRWWIAIPMTALSVCILLWCSVGPIPGPATVALAEHRTLQLKRELAGPTMRGSAAGIGDHIQATVASADRYRALWVYHDDRKLIVACPSGPACSGSRDTMTAAITLQIVGSYTFLMVTSTSPFPEPQGSFDADWAAATEAGATTQLERIEVH